VPGTLLHYRYLNRATGSSAPEVVIDRLSAERAAGTGGTIKLAWTRRRSKLVQIVRGVRG
jgi:hypothetical protein